MAQSQPIDIRFKDLVYEVRVGYRGSRKQILKGLDGYYASGELTGIIGPSGAGKSTLLNVLSGFQQGTLTGTIEYIGSDGKQGWDKYKKQSCYIQQTDSLHGLFTVRESMTIATYLKIDNNVTPTFKHLLIDNILDTLNLTSVKDTRVEMLSGGQRKRLSIALELIDNPPIMFLDEPTTGLDSLAAVQCITALQTLAKAGRTVICTIHQPSAALYQMFDHIYLVVDGHCMYASAPDNTVHYFAQQGFQCPKYHNPADYVLEVVSHEYGVYDNQLIVAAKKYCRRNETPLKSREIQRAHVVQQTSIWINPPSEMMRFWVLLHRCMLLLYRDRTVTHLKLVFHFLVAILLGLLFEHAGDDGSKIISNASFLQMNVVYLTYTSMLPAVLRFPLELAILKKERFNNWYQLKTYYVATLVSSIPLQTFLALIYSGVSYLMTSQPLEWHRFLMYLLIAILLSFTAEAMGLGFGTIFNPVNGTFMGSITICVMMCLAGFLAFFKHMPVFLYYTSYLSCLRYAYDGLIQAIYGFHREAIDCPGRIYCHYRLPRIILDELGMSRPMFWIDVVVLFGYFVILRIVVYMSLKRRLSKVC